MRLAAPQNSIYNCVTGGAVRREDGRCLRWTPSLHFVSRKIAHRPASPRPAGGEQTKRIAWRRNVANFWGWRSAALWRRRERGRGSTRPRPSRSPQPVPFAADTVLKAAMMLAASPYKAPDAPLPSQFSGLTFEQYAAIRRAPGTAIWAGREARLFARALAPRVRLYDPDRDQYRRERAVAEAGLRPGRLRFRQAATAGPVGRSRLLGPADPRAPPTTVSRTPRSSRARAFTARAPAARISA